MPTTNKEIAQLFLDMAGLLESKGESGFKARAYRRAARYIDGLTDPLEQMVNDRQDLTQLPGVGDAISKKIAELVNTGKVLSYEKLKSGAPDGVLALMRVPGVGPKTAMFIINELGLNTVQEVKKAIEEGKVAALPGIGDRTFQKLLYHFISVSRGPLYKDLPG